jgi:hypothetical protein
MTDVMLHAGSVPLAFFATLETLRRNHGLNDVQPDCARWYRFVVGSARKNPEMAEKIREILGAYAVETGTEDTLKSVLVARPQGKRTFAERLSRVRMQLNSFRASASDGPDNTILTAAHTMDTILGQDFGAVMEGAMTPRAAWDAARRRSKAFQKTL